jgi:hypothetical protein
MKRMIFLTVIFALMVPAAAGAQYRPEYLLNLVDTLIAKVDSTLIMATQPPVRTLSAASELFNTLDIVGAGKRTLPIAGVDVTGATGAIVTITFATFTGDFKLYDMYTASQTDTSTTCYGDTGLVYINVDAAEVLSTSITHYVRPPHGMDYLIGYYHMRIAGAGSAKCNLQDAIATIKVMY